MQIPFIIYGTVLWYKRQYTDKTRTLMCMRASGASELGQFWDFYILKLLFLSIFCRYIRYSVGTNDMLVGLNVPTNFQMYRQKPEKALLGGQLPPLPPPPPPPSGYANGCIRNPGFWIQPHVWWLHRVKGVQPCFLVKTIELHIRKLECALRTPRVQMLLCRFEEAKRHLNEGKIFAHWP